MHIPNLLTSAYFFFLWWGVAGEWLECDVTTVRRVGDLRMCDFFFLQGCAYYQQALDLLAAQNIDMPQVFALFWFV